MQRSDGFHPGALKELTHRTAELISVVYNVLLELALVLGGQKVANTTAIFKKMYKGDLENHRFVSLIFLPGKLWSI